MTALINADTSSGVIVTSDTSGNLALQSAGTTKLTVSSAGVTTTGTTSLANLTATGTFGGGVITSGTAVASTSGTSIDFTSIPSWVKRVTVMLNGVSLDAATNVLFQIGSGSVDATATYNNTRSQIGSVTAGSTASATSSGWELYGDATAAETRNGALTLVKVSDYIWVANGFFSGVTNTTTYITSGSKSLSGVLDRVRITSVSGTANFDAGSINILYEG
jgi:hypothetical protein